MGPITHFQKGFSLVELMVVISILSLISGLAIPNIAAMKIKAAKAEPQTNLRVFEVAVKSYQAETGYYASPDDGYVDSLNLGPQKLFGFEMYTGTIPFLGISFAPDIGRKLKYHYWFELREDSYGIAAQNSEVTIAGLSYRYGSSLPTQYCKARLAASGSAFSYLDYMKVESENGSMLGTPIGVLNALKNCF